MSSKNYISDFPKGRVAKSLRQVLYPGLKEHDVECISVILISHLMIEQKINTVLFHWMSNSIPYMVATGIKMLSYTTKPSKLKWKTTLSNLISQRNWP